MAVQVRYFEDVNVGDELGPLEKRPNSVSLFRYSAVTWNSHTIHYDQEYATKGEGHPGILVQAHLHGAYLTQLVMDWLGGGGTLRKLSWQNRQRAIPGDVLVCRGKVIEKSEESGKRLVRCEIREENQRGEVCAPGEAVVELPSRGG